MFLKTVLASLVLVMAFSVTAFAETGESQTTVTPINSSVGIEKTVVPFHAPKENKLPWGFVEGKIANPVEGHPVIIQIYKNGEAIHFAQTTVNDDGTYEYKFRVRDFTDSRVTKIFEGDYIVKIFKVVYLDKDTTSA
ncbi:hypothetical protein [Candidatus Nitrosotenuis cloacae]|uniref:hypothetical protein n=1 Tax=Candidatus Nitrosotenuis cloacae TaxID=1603555 RepID=UPI00227F3F72|nr:hypothetical protein [Candidatus Nitrosotenuis cloacae]